MADRSASVSFSADVNGYTQSLTQAIAVTDQYSQAADTMLGKVAKVGGSMANTLIQKTAALTTANKTATAQAAAYQQKLSGLESTAKILGEKTFPKLEKVTKDLAKAYPIGIGQAVEQMKALQESGVTNIKTSEKLAKSFTQLGGATNTFGPDMGRQMVELTRSMGNSLEMVDGMGDSLTTLTKKYGGTASGVLAFSKSIAPIAATVGMSQTQVMGLSTAFSRLGEDGFYAGNALNKVLIDLNRSVRDGTPELRAYAEVMNKSVEGLREQFKADPGSVLVDFTTAINAQGPNAIRVLDRLGLEGVRTTKALTSLSREGNLGEIISEASSSFGGGAAAIASETAFSGVNDQITRLNESMSQMTAAAGKPLLGVLQGVLGQATNIVDMTNDVMESKPAQVVGGAAQFAGGALKTVGGGALTALNMAMMAGLGIRGGRFAGKQIGQFYAGQDAFIAKAAFPDEMMPSPQGWMAQRGAASAARRGLGASDAAMIGTVIPTTAGVIRTLGSVAARSGRRVLSDVAGATQFAATVTASDMRTAIGQNKIPTALGGVSQENWVKIRAAWESGGKVAAGRAMVSAAGEIELAASKAGGSIKKTASALGNLTTAVGAVGAASGRMALGGILGTTVGKSTIVGAAAVGVGMAGYAMHKNQQEGYERLKGSQEDPFRAFNQFAEKAGIATIQVAALGEAAAKAAGQIVKEENTTVDQALTVNAREAELIAGPDYPVSAMITGAERYDALNLALSNPKMSPEALGRIVLDASAEKNIPYGERLGKQISAVQQQFAEDPMDTLVAALDESDAQTNKNMSDPGFWSGIWQGFMGNDSNREKTVRDVAAQSIGQMYTRDEKIGGAEYAASNQLSRAEEMWKLLQSDEYRNRPSTRVSGTRVLEEVLGANLPDLNATTQEYSFDQAMAGQKDSKFFAAWEKQRKGEVAEAKQIADESLKTQRESDAAVEKLTGVNLRLADILGEGNKVAGEKRVLVNELEEADYAGMSKSQAAVARVQKEPFNQALIIDAGKEIAQYSLKVFEGSTSKTRVALIRELATATDDGRKAAVQSALDQLKFTPQAMAEQSSKSPLDLLRNRISAGQAARRSLEDAPSNAAPEFIALNQSEMESGLAAWEQLQATIRSTAIQVRDTLKQMGRAEDDYGRQTSRAWRDWGKQRAYAAKDHLHTEFIANRDFRQQMSWSDQDFNRQRRYVKADFDRQATRADENYQRQVARAEADYRRTTARAEEDYQRSKKRSQESFARSMLRAEQDYFRQRSRMIEAHDRALARQVEDNAKAMYSPYERMMHNRVQDLVGVLGNLEEQNKYLAKQMAAIDKLKESGLSQQAVDLLDLGNPANLQQTLRIANDATQNPNLIAEANAAAAQRATLSQSYTTSENNVDFRRSEEDFGISLAQMAEDHATSMSRATEDFNISMTQAAEDFVISITRSSEEYRISMGRAREDFTITTEQSLTDYLISLKRSDTEYEISIKRARTQHNQQMAELDYQYKTQMARQKDAFTTSIADAAEDFGISMARMNEDLVSGLSDVLLSNDAIVELMKKRIKAMPKELQGPLNDALDTLMKGMDKPVDEWTGKERKLAKFKYYDPRTGQYTDGGPITIVYGPKVPTESEKKLDKFKYYNPVTGLYEDGGPIRIDYAPKKDKAPAEFKLDKFAWWDPSSEGYRTDGLFSMGYRANGPKDPNLPKFPFYDPSTEKWITQGNMGIGFELKSADDDYKIPKFKYYDPATGKYTEGGAIGIKIKASFEQTGGGAGAFEDGPSAPATGKGAVNGPTNQGWDGYSGYWQRYRTPPYGFHGGADLGQRGDPVYSVTGGKVKYVKTSATVQSSSGSYGRHVVISDGKHDFLYAHMSDQRVTDGQSVSPGTRVGTVGNTGNTRPLGSGHHLHFEVRPAGAGHSSAINPGPWLALGGIATKQMPAMIAEAGYPEAVVPLNERGAKYLAQVMARYVSNDEAKGSKVAPYATNVTVHNTVTYDQSTKVLGPVTVEADDPAKFGRAMAAKARRDQLVQPVRSR